MEYKTVSEVSEEILDSLGEKSKITIDGYDYTIPEVRAIKESIKEYIQGIPPIEKDDPDREKKIFSYLYVMMACQLSFDKIYNGISKLSGYGRELAEDKYLEIVNCDSFADAGKELNSLIRTIYPKAIIMWRI